MRTPESKHKLYGHSLKEIRHALDVELTRIRGLELQATDQAMARAHLINAIFLWFIAQPEPARDAIVRAGTESYRTHLESDVPIPIRILDGISDAPEPTRGRGLGGVTQEISDVDMKPKKRQPKRQNTLPIKDR